MPEAVPTETPTARQTMSAAEHCAAARDEFANAQHLYASDPDEYRRAMDSASMHLRIAEVMTQGSSLVTEIARAETNPAWKSIRMNAVHEATAWNELLGRVR
ncbi:hypothetical protein ALI144C_52380 [Actinosynnema sp. ALI-1.44]|uniref:hypothetical protein n=1 Tax=Actinosynnema sp. ALI-1.44 TaxID=1933779 RepID=UPI00097CB1C5|nr:hypothetical protein [Actinosynnema sp. ALI-1.44]ONI71133.1 hypothetical protein ALI144C_52380 [Actinosynnema sp. ALI-1.44]